MLAILDYKAGNQTSVRRALDHLGIPCVITADPAVVDSAAGVIFPGVGAAGQAMRHLQDSGLDAVLRNVVSSGRPCSGSASAARSWWPTATRTIRRPSALWKAAVCVSTSIWRKAGRLSASRTWLEYDFPQAGEPHPEGCPG